MHPFHPLLFIFTFVTLLSTLHASHKKGFQPINPPTVGEKVLHGVTSLAKGAASVHRRVSNTLRTTRKDCSIRYDKCMARCNKKHEEGSDAWNDGWFECGVQQGKCLENAVA